MRVCFLVPDLSASGGVAVALGHARRLAEQDGFEVDIAATAGELPGDSYDVAVATWWRTAEEAWRVPARRRVLFAQGPDPFFFRQDEAPERLAAELALQMPFDVITVSAWMARVIEAFRPGASCEIVPIGIDKQVFAADEISASLGTPLRVLVEGQPSLWFKGVPEAVAAVRAMSRPAKLTVVSLDPSSAQDLSGDRVVGALEPREMAALYRESDVVVKLSRFEGFGLAPLEAMHAGTPSIVTPYGGHSDYVEHGTNGLVVGFDDPAAVTAWLDRLATDSRLLERLSEGAHATADAWPDANDSARRFGDALRRRADTSELQPGPGFARVAASVRAQTELARTHLQHLSGSLEWTEGALAEARGEVDRVHAEVDRLNDLVEELFRSRDECSDMLDQERAALEEIKQSRAYRAGVALRRLKPGG